MKFEKIRFVALIIASFINMWIGLLLIIVGAHIVEGLLDNETELSFDSASSYTFIFMLLSLVAIIVAWLRNKIGGILITLSAIGLLYFDLDDLHFGNYPIYLLVLTGVTIIIFSFGEKWFTKKG